jgi:hypothetical protein
LLLLLLLLPWCRRAAMLSGLDDFLLPLLHNER